VFTHLCAVFDGKQAVHMYLELHRGSQKVVQWISKDAYFNDHLPLGLVDFGEEIL